MSQKTYLVAGGAGFIGSHLIKRILDEGQKVLCVDNLITGTKQNFQPFLSNPDFTYREANICDAQALGFKEKIDYVLNLACPASPIDYRKYPLETLDVSSLGVKNLLNIAKEQSARFFQTSTSEVYGDPLEHPQKETYWGNVNCYGERSCYDEAKRFAESLIYIYRHDLKVDTAIIRIFNTYGPNMKPFDGRVVSTFIRQALADEDITIFGEGTQTRSFCYISDQIEAQWRMIHSQESGPINIGNPHEFTMLELAEKVIAVTGSKSQIIHKPLPKDDPTQRKPDISLAKEKLQWQPKIELEEGIRLTVEWFKNKDY